MLKTWMSTWSLQTRFLALTVILSSLVLLVTNWVTTVSSIRAVESATGEQTSQAARRLGSILEGASIEPFPCDSPSGWRDLGIEQISVEWMYTLISMET
jgi:hypothetical protein